MDACKGILTLFAMASFITLTGQITESADISRAVEKYRSYRTDKSEVEVYRITVVLTRDRREMESRRSRFYRMFPEMPIEWSYSQPYYTVKHGMYIHKREAWPDLVKIQEKYPNAILSTERVRPEEYFDN